MNSSLYVLTQPANLFYPRGIETAAEWLNENVQPNDFILADIETSQILAQRTSLKVYIGHEMETLDFQNKESMMNAYFKGTAADEWLSQTPVRWVIVGPYESNIAEVFNPPVNLELMYDKNSVKIYRVVAQ